MTNNAAALIFLKEFFLEKSLLEESLLEEAFLEEFGAELPETSFAAAGKGVGEGFPS